jgi:hypothetical protein
MSSGQRISSPHGQVEYGRGHGLGRQHRDEHGDPLSRFGGGAYGMMAIEDDTVGRYLDGRISRLTRSDQLALEIQPESDEIVPGGSQLQGIDAMLDRAW